MDPLDIISEQYNSYYHENARENIMSLKFRMTKTS